MERTLEDVGRCALELPGQARLRNVETEWCGQVFRRECAYTHGRRHPPRVRLLAAAKSFGPEWARAARRACHVAARRAADGIVACCPCGCRSVVRPAPGARDHRRWARAARRQP